MLFQGPNYKVVKKCLHIAKKLYFCTLKILKIMNRITNLILVLLIVAFYASCSKSNEHVDMSELKSLKDSASYALGFLNGMQASMTPEASVNVDLYTKAFKQGYNKDTAGVWDVEKMRDIITEYLNTAQMKMQEEAMAKAKPDLERADKFLQENAKKEGVVSTVSGLQYKVIKQGTGIKPTLNNGDRIIINYIVWCLNEKNEWDQITSTFNNDGTNPGPMGIDGQSEGLKEALLLMNAGSRYQIWLHPNLGYGDLSKLQMYEIEVLKVLHEE